MSCCFGKTTDGKEPKKSISDSSDLLVKKAIKPVNKPEDHKIEYLVSLKTGDFRKSGTNGPVYINIIGRDDKQTGFLLLSGPNKTLLQNSLRKFQISAIDIGKPQRIVIRHDDKSTGWYVDYVEISVHNFLIRFVANRWLNQVKNDRKLEAELFGSEQPAVLFNIEIQTGDEQIDQLDSPVYIQVYGTMTATPKVYLEAKNAIFNKNSLAKFNVSSNNVGEIQRIVVGHEGLGNIKDWYLHRIKVHMLSEQQEFTVNKWLSPTRGDQQLFVELSKEQPPSPPPAPSIYLISIQTGDVVQNQTNENVEMIIRGSNGQISKFLLKEHVKTNEKQLFQKGNLDEFEIKHENIGNIESLTIGFSDSQQKSSWLLESIDIKYRETSFYFRGNYWLSNRLGPNFSWIILKPAVQTDDMNYKIRVETGQSGIESNVILCIYGDEETTANLPLKTTNDGLDAKFDKDSTLEFECQAVDVGKIKKINIGHDGKGNEQEWFLKAIEIEKKDERYIFKANRWLSEVKDDQQTFIDLLPDELKAPASTPVLKKDQAIYSITIVTSSDDHAGTDSGVLMTIFGEKDITKQFQLNRTKQGDQAQFGAGTTNEFEMELDDVGHINKINIGQDGTGSHPKWRLESVQIQKGSENYNFSCKETVDQSTAFVDLTPTLSRETPTLERSKAKTPTPEPAKSKTPTPEPIKPKTPTPEPTQTKTPEPVKPKTPTPEPVKVKTPTPESSKSKTPSPELKTTRTPRSVTSDQKDSLVKEVTYKISIQSDSNSDGYLIVSGQNGQTNKLYLKDSLKSTKKNDFEFQANDVGKISKILLGQENDTKWNVENITIKAKTETTTFNVERTLDGNTQIELTPSAIPKKIETIYKILVQTGSSQEEGDHSNLNLIIFGQNIQTKQIPLDETTKINKKKTFKKEDKIEFEYKTLDIRKITKIRLQTDSTKSAIHWHIQQITIKRNNETTTFNIDHEFDDNIEHEYHPSPLIKKSETPRQRAKTTETIPKIATKTQQADYQITISSGEQVCQVPVTLKIRGDDGLVQIPLTKTTNDQQPFQSNSTHEFSIRTNDVGLIRRITIEHQGTNHDLLWHLKSIQIQKGNETYNFHADIRLDYKDKKVNLYPIGSFYGHQREDYVQSELRRLRESLRTESAKLHPPTHKEHQPYVFNDLSPYFDTSAVERAIYSPFDAPPGYFTRVTALRIVEPWEAYGMDYGVNYELLKQRKNRSLSTKRPTSKTVNNSIDRKQGSTHLPKFPCVNMQKPAEYSRSLTMNDVSKIRSFIRHRYTAQAHSQIDKDYKRTHDDIYRMELDNVSAYHQSNRDNMLRVYHSYLENTPGSKKALQEFCDHLSANNTKSSVDTTT